MYFAFHRHKLIGNEKYKVESCDLNCQAIFRVCGVFARRLFSIIPSRLACDVFIWVWIVSYLGTGKGKGPDVLLWRLQEKHHIMNFISLVEKRLAMEILEHYLDLETAWAL